MLEGTFVDENVSILKDDGCNTNVISADFVNKHRKKLDVRKCNLDIYHSSKETREQAKEIVFDTGIRIGDTTYRSNWAISNTRYDVLLGMPWHEQNNPNINYQIKEVNVNGNNLPKVQKQHTEKIEISNIGVKKFRSLLRKKRQNVEIFMVQSVSHPNNNGKGTKEQGRNARMKKLIEKYHSVFVDDLPDGLPPSRGVDHEIKTDENSSPPYRPPYQMSAAELQATKEYIAKHIRSGKLRPSRSPYGSPLFFVKQKGELRAVIDYRALNLITKKNNAPIPRIDEMLDRLGQARVFSKMDLKTGFHQIRVKPEDIEKTAITTRYGLYEFLVMPMGLCNAPATFQSLTNEIFYDYMDDFIVVYIDELLVFSKNEEQHIHHLQLVLERLKRHSLYVGRKKCEFMTNSIEFLGLQVSEKGISVDESKLSAVKEWPTPKSVTEVRSFIGLMQFFRRFIRHFSEIAAPLTNLTKKGSGIHDWNSKCDQSFKLLKEKLTSAPILAPPDWTKPFRCHVDAMQTAVGGTLTQLDANGHDRVIAYYSRRLNSAEENYTSNDRELLGLVYFLKRFRCYLEGSSFEVLTDNKVLQNFLTKKTLSRREARWLDLFAEYNLDKITFVQGSAHVLGDALSRIPKTSTIQMANTSIFQANIEDALEPHYKTDRFFSKIVNAQQGNYPDDETSRERLKALLPHFEFKQGKLYFENKVCVPRQKIKDILRLAHDSPLGGHFSFHKTLSRLEKFYWPKKFTDIKEYCEGCMTCQQAKDSRTKPFGRPQPLELPTRRWGSIATDFIVSLPVTKSANDAITTYIDRFSERVHFLPTTSRCSAEIVPRDFYDNIFKLHGLPDNIVSDRDPRFTNFGQN